MGCSWDPSPALMMLERQWRARKCGAPEALCRMTIMSGAIASRLRAVSSRLSPFTTLEAEGEKLSVSADNRFSAISKEERVRVEGSMKKFTTVLPRSVGTFLMARVDTSAKARAVSRMRVISSAVSPWIPSRCRCVRAESGAGAAFCPSGPASGRATMSGGRPAGDGARAGPAGGRAGRRRGAALSCLLSPPSSMAHLAARAASLGPPFLAAFFSGRRTIRTSSAPSSSLRRTWTISSRFVGTFLPT